jgi:ABC-type nitrate/sulfonate/bicarbonate transport system substrate-binding protein
MMKSCTKVLYILTFALLVTACQEPSGEMTSTPLKETETAEPTPATLMLDWVPNTNHTGIFVAQAKGFFSDAGLDVEIIQPGEVFAEQAVVGGAADFGVSFQEQVTLARADDVPIVSIAAIIQHNTSGFASRAELGVKTPADWEGLRYGSYGNPFEEPTLRVLMECAKGDFHALEIVDTGFADPLALLDEKQTDLAWIFYAWQGVQADLQGIDLDIIMMADWFDCIPDYYTPVFIAHETTIRERPELVRKFLLAVSRGYEYAIDHPDEAATILLEAVPELDEELVRASQAWLSPRYQADALRWGEQSFSVWDDYSRWMAQYNIIPSPIDAASAYTNDFLP